MYEGLLYLRLRDERPRIRGKVRRVDGFGWSYWQVYTPGAGHLYAKDDAFTFDPEVAEVLAYLRVQSLFMVDRKTHAQYRLSWEDFLAHRRWITPSKSAGSKWEVSRALWTVQSPPLDPRAMLVTTDLDGDDLLAKARAQTVERATEILSMGPAEAAAIGQRPDPDGGSPAATPQRVETPRGTPPEKPEDWTQDRYARFVERFKFRAGVRG